MTMLEWALKYAEHNYAVFPLVPRSKAPATEHGFKDATTDLNQIRRWWNKNPNYNIGVATGHGLVVIDVDDKPDEGKLGTMSLFSWEKKNGAFEPTWTVLTGTGGYHYWYKTSENFVNTTEILGAIDVRSLGGYVVAPPSVHPNGNPYEWEASGDPDDIEIADLSGSALKLLKEYASNADRKTGKRKKSTPYKELTKIKKGKRQDALMSLQGSLVNMNMTPEAIKAAVRAENESKCEPPFTEAELQKEIFPFLDRDIKPTADYAETVVPAQTLDDGIDDDELGIITLDQVKLEKAEWLESGYIPKNTITIVCGDGGVGKTSIWCSLAAAISKGEQTFLTAKTAVNSGILRENKKVMFFSAEDSVSVVLKAKMQEVGADQKNIYLVDPSNKHFKDIKFSSKYLEKLIDKVKPAVCIFDPLQSFIDKKVKMSERNAMRQEVEPLIQLGQNYGTTFILIMHTNKQSNVWGRQRMADSADLWDIARSVLMVGEIDAAEGTGYISQEKNSYARQSETVIYKITNGVATWQANSNKKDKDFVQELVKKKNENKQSGDVNDVCDFILSTIEDSADKRIAVIDLYEDLKIFGYSKYIVRKAVANLIEAKRAFRTKDGYEGKTYLSTRNRQD